ncbi:Tetratricopeptide TPR_1 repeat-containing protein [Desulfovibrio sp. X2]|uniref:tetratricopeptide repeat protein n=1 Tax=Desulfovibrio sp. X2 TaxID=941449 RepID=UPI000358C937|nr:tetratricopeptide repeat protein [Desulfovibrio sp. X2]EPR44071.1 Tetratricopeptide TPR_1 repeat-containing protein [Desulfovibrio sp. X2]
MSPESSPKGFVRKDMFYVVIFFCLALGFAAGVITGTMYNPPRPAQPSGMGGGGMPPGMGQGMGQGAPQGMPQGMPQMPPQQGAQQQPAQQDQLSPAERAKLLELEMAVSKQPGNVNALNQLGNFYFDHDKPAEAVDAYKKSLAIKDAQPDVWTDLGVMYRELTQYQQALDCFNKALALDPKHQVAHFNKGVVLVFDLNQKDKGVAVWKELLAINPNAKAPNGTPLGQLIDSVEQQ